MNPASSRLLVGITTGTEPFPTPYASLPGAYIEAVSRAGALPVVLDAARFQPDEGALDGLDVLILSGGTDINPICYGQPPHPALTKVDHDRDVCELALLRAWLKTGKPLLGIGRGLHLLTVAEGGSLIQDIASLVPEAGQHQQIATLGEPCHRIETTASSTLRRLLGNPPVLPVNSAHHQAVDQVAPGYRVSAVAADGVIEAVEAADGRLVMGVQWHPEAFPEATGQPFLNRFFAACSGRGQQAA